MGMRNRRVGTRVIPSASLHIMNLDAFRIMPTDVPLRRDGVIVFGYCVAAVLSMSIFGDAQRHGLDACKSPHKVTQLRSAIRESGRLSVGSYASGQNRKSCSITVRWLVIRRRRVG